jgi:hypothetical protein
LISILLLRFFLNNSFKQIEKLISGAFNQQEEIRERKLKNQLENESESEEEIDMSARQRVKDFKNPWESYRADCERPEKYRDNEDSKENSSNFKRRILQFTKACLAFFARNFYNFKSAALIISFLLNVILLSLRWETQEEAAERVRLGVLDHEESEYFEDSVEEIFPGGELDPEDEILVFSDWIFDNVNEVFNWCAFLHSILAVAKLIAYYQLKVPLLIFKREKVISRKIEFDGLYIR